MIKIKTFEVPNRLDELSIGQYQEVSRIASDKERGYVQQYIDIFTYLGVDDIWDNVTDEELTEWITEFKESGEPSTEFVKELEIEGYTYRAYEGDEFKLFAKDLAQIEKKIKVGNSDICYIMGVLFKRTDLSKAEHYTEAHLKQKAKLFKDVKADICTPYLAKIGQRVSSMLEKKIHNEELEQS